MSKIQGITEQELRQYQLLQYLLCVQKRWKFEDKQIYVGGVMNPRTLASLKGDLQAFEQQRLLQLPDGAKKGASDVWPGACR